MMASCLEEGRPLGVETAGSPNICLANPSNLPIVILNPMLLIVISMLVILIPMLFDSDVGVGDDKTAAKLCKHNPHSKFTTTIINR